MKRKLNMISFLNQKVLNDRLIIAILIAILIFGFFLRIYTLDAKSLWVDEIGEVIVASNDILGVLMGASTHYSPPLDYLILHFFLILGKNNFIARLPSVVFGVASIGMIYLLGADFYSKKVGLISAFLLAISPFCIWYSQEARMYSLFLFLAIISFYFFFRSIKINSCFLWGTYLVSTILAIYTHYFAFFMIVVQLIFLMFIFFKDTSHFLVRKYEHCKIPGLYKEGTFFKFCICLGIMFIFFLPQVNIFLSQTGNLKEVLVYGIKPDLNFFSEIIGTTVGITGIQGGMLGNGIFLLITQWGINKWIIALALLTMIFSIVIVGIQDSSKSYSNETILLILWYLLPILIIFILSYVRGPMTTSRNMIFIIPAFTILFAKGICDLGNKCKRIVLRFSGTTKYTLNINGVILVIIIFLGD